MMKKYVMPETVNVNIEGADLMQESSQSLPSAGPGTFDEGQGMAPKKTV